MDSYDNQLLYEGRLLVKTEGALGRRSWILRHVILGGRTLEWYSDAGRTQVVGSVSLEGATVLLPQQQQQSEGGAAPVVDNSRSAFMFEIDWDGQDYLPLRALSSAELRDWVSALSLSVAAVSQGILQSVTSQATNAATAAAASMSPAKNALGYSVSNELPAIPSSSTSPVMNSAATHQQQLGSSSSDISSPQSSSSSFHHHHQQQQQQQSSDAMYNSTATIQSENVPSKEGNSGVGEAGNMAGFSPSMGIAAIHRTRAAQAATLAKQLVKLGSGRRLPPPAPPPLPGNLSTAEIAALLASTASTTIASPPSSSSSSSSSFDSKTSSHTTDRSRSATEINDASSSTPAPATSAPFAETSLCSGSLYFLRPAAEVANAATSFSSASGGRLPAELWVPRFGIAEGHELHLYQSQKATRELETVECAGAFAEPAPRRASPPPGAECILYTLASGTQLYFAVPAPDTTTAALVAGGNGVVGGGATALSREGWMRVLNACAMYNGDTSAFVNSNNTTSQQQQQRLSSPPQQMNEPGLVHVPPHKRQHNMGGKLRSVITAAADPARGSSTYNSVASTIVNSTNNNQSVLSNAGSSHTPEAFSISPNMQQQQQSQRLPLVSELEFYPRSGGSTSTTSSAKSHSPDRLILPYGAEHTAPPTPVGLRSAAAALVGGVSSSTTNAGSTILFTTSPPTSTNNVVYTNNNLYGDNDSVAGSVISVSSNTGGRSRRGRAPPPPPPAGIPAVFADIHNNHEQKYALERQYSGVTSTAQARLYEAQRALLEATVGSSGGSVDGPGFSVSRRDSAASSQYLGSFFGGAGYSGETAQHSNMGNHFSAGGSAIAPSHATAARSRSSSAISGTSRGPYAFSARLRQANFDWVSASKENSAEFENALLDDCSYISREPREIFSVLKLSAGSVIAKIGVFDRPVDKAVQIGQKIRSILESPSLESPSITALFDREPRLTAPSSPPSTRGEIVATQQHTTFDGDDNNNSNNGNNSIPSSSVDKAVTKMSSGSPASNENDALTHVPHLAVDAFEDAKNKSSSDANNTNDNGDGLTSLVAETATTSLAENMHRASTAAVIEGEPTTNSSSSSEENEASPKLNIETEKNGSSSAEAKSNNFASSEETPIDNANVALRKLTVKDSGNHSGNEHSFELSPLLRGGEPIQEAIAEATPEAEHSHDSDSDETSVHANQGNDYTSSSIVPQLPIGNSKNAADYTEVGDTEDDSLWLTAHENTDNQSSSPAQQQPPPPPQVPSTSRSTSKNFAAMTGMLGAGTTSTFPTANGSNNNIHYSSNNGSNNMRPISPSSVSQVGTVENVASSSSSRPVSPTSSVPSYLRRLNRDFDVPSNILSTTLQQAQANNNRQSPLPPISVAPPSHASQLLAARRQEGALSPGVALSSNSRQFILFAGPTSSPLDRITKEAGAAENGTSMPPSSNPNTGSTLPKSLFPGSVSAAISAAVAGRAGHTQPRAGASISQSKGASAALTSASVSVVVDGFAVEQTSSIASPADLSKTRRNTDGAAENTRMASSSSPGDLRAEIAASVSKLNQTSSPSIVSPGAFGKEDTASSSPYNLPSNANVRRRASGTFSVASTSTAHHSPYKASLHLPPALWTDKSSVAAFVEQELAAVAQLLSNLPREAMGVLISVPLHQTLSQNNVVVDETPIAVGGQLLKSLSAPITSPNPAQKTENATLVIPSIASSVAVTAPTTQHELEAHEDAERSRRRSSFGVPGVSTTDAVGNDVLAIVDSVVDAALIETPAADMVAHSEGEASLTQDDTKKETSKETAIAVAPMPHAATAAEKDAAAAIRQRDEEMIVGAITRVIAAGTSKALLRLPLSESLLQDLCLVDECLAVAGDGYVLTDDNADALRPGAKSVRVQIDPVTAEGVSIRLSRALHGDSLWKTAPTFTAVSVAPVPAAVSSDSPSTKDSTFPQQQQQQQQQLPPLPPMPKASPSSSPPPPAITSNTESAESVTPNPTTNANSSRSHSTQKANPASSPLSPGSVQEKIAMEELVSSPLSASTVTRHKEELFRFYTERVPSKASDEHVNSAWEAYGLGVWPALASKYGTATIAPYASAAALPLAFLLPGRLQYELNAARRRASEAAHGGLLIPSPSSGLNSAASGRRSMSTPPPGMMMLIPMTGATTTAVGAGVGGAPEVLVGITDGGSNLGSVTGPSPRGRGLSTSGNFLPHLHDRLITRSPPTVIGSSGSPLPIVVATPNGPMVMIPAMAPFGAAATGSPASLSHTPPLLSAEEASANQLQLFGSDVSSSTGVVIAEPRASPASPSLPSSSSTKQQQPSSSPSHREMLGHRASELATTIDSSRRALDELYALADTLQAARMSGRGASTAAPMLAEVLKGIERTQAAQRAAQAELSAVAAEITAANAAAIAFPVPAIDTTPTKPVEEESVPTLANPPGKESNRIDDGEEEEKKNETEHASISPSPVSEEAVTAPSISSNIPILVVGGSRPWLFKARVANAVHEWVTATPERGSQFEAMLIRDCAQLTQYPESTFLVAGLIKGSVIATIGIVGLSDQESARIAALIHFAVENGNLPEVGAMLASDPAATGLVPFVLSVAAANSGPIVPETTVDEAPIIPLEKEDVGPGNLALPVVLPSEPSKVSLTPPRATTPAPSSVVIPEADDILEKDKIADAATAVEAEEELADNPALVPVVSAPLTVARPRRSATHIVKRSILQTPALQRFMQDAEDDENADLPLDTIRAVAEELGLDVIHHGHPAQEQHTPLLASSMQNDRFSGDRNDDDDITGSVAPKEEDSTSVDDVPAPSEVLPSLAITEPELQSGSISSAESSAASITAPAPLLSSAASPSASGWKVVDGEDSANLPDGEEAIGKSVHVRPPHRQSSKDGKVKDGQEEKKDEIEEQHCTASSEPSISSSDRADVGNVKESYPGIIRYAGPTQFASGEWLGIELGEPRGSHDGTLGGVFYFACDANTAIGARPGSSASLPYGIFVPRESSSSTSLGGPTQMNKNNDKNYTADISSMSQQIERARASSPSNGSALVNLLSSPSSATIHEIVGTPSLSSSSPQEFNGTAHPSSPPPASSIAPSSSTPSSPSTAQQMMATPPLFSPHSASPSASSGQKGFVVHIPGRRSPTSIRPIGIMSSPKTIPGIYYTQTSSLREVAAIDSPMIALLDSTSSSSSSLSIPPSTSMIMTAFAPASPPLDPSGDVLVNFSSPNGGKKQQRLPGTTPGSATTAAASAGTEGKLATGTSTSSSTSPRPGWNSSTKNQWSGKVDWRQKLSLLEENKLSKEEENIFVVVANGGAPVSSAAALALLQPVSGAVNPLGNVIAAAAVTPTNTTATTRKGTLARGGANNNSTTTSFSKSGSTSVRAKPSVHVSGASSVASGDGGDRGDNRSVMSLVLADAKERATAAAKQLQQNKAGATANPSSSSKVDRDGSSKDIFPVDAEEKTSAEKNTGAPASSTAGKTIPHGLMRSSTGLLVPIDPARPIHTAAGDIFVLKAGTPPAPPVFPSLTGNATSNSSNNNNTNTSAANPNTFASSNFFRPPSTGLSYGATTSFSSTATMGASNMRRASPMVMQGNGGRSSSPAPSESSGLDEPVLLTGGYSGRSLLASPQLRADPSLAGLAMTGPEAVAAAAGGGTDSYERVGFKPAAPPMATASMLTSETYTADASYVDDAFRPNADIDADVDPRVVAWLEALQLSHAVAPLAEAIAIAKYALAHPEAFADEPQEDGQGDASLAEPMVVPILLRDIASLEATEIFLLPGLSQSDLKKLSEAVAALRAVVPAVLQQLPSSSNEADTGLAQIIQGSSENVTTITTIATAIPAASSSTLDNTTSVSATGRVSPASGQRQQAVAIGGIPLDSKLGQLPPLAESFNLTATSLPVPIEGSRAPSLPLPSSGPAIAAEVALDRASKALAAARASTDEGSLASITASSASAIVSRIPRPPSSTSVTTKERTKQTEVPITTSASSAVTRQSSSSSLTSTDRILQDVRIAADLSGSGGSIVLSQAQLDALLGPAPEAVGSREAVVEAYDDAPTTSAHSSAKPTSSSSSSSSSSNNTANNAPPLEPNAAIKTKRPRVPSHVVPPRPRSSSGSNTSSHVSGTTLSLASTSAVVASGSTAATTPHVSLSFEANGKRKPSGNNTTIPSFSALADEADAALAALIAPPLPSSVSLYSGSSTSSVKPSALSILAATHHHPSSKQAGGGGGAATATGTPNMPQAIAVHHPTGSSVASSFRPDLKAAAAHIRGERRSAQEKTLDLLAGRLLHAATPGTGASLHQALASPPSTQTTFSAPAAPLVTAPPTSNISRFKALQALAAGLPPTSLIPAPILVMPVGVVPLSAAASPAKKDVVEQQDAPLASSTVEKKEKKKEKKEKNKHKETVSGATMPISPSPPVDDIGESASHNKKGDDDGITTPSVKSKSKKDELMASSSPTLGGFTSPGSPPPNQAPTSPAAASTSSSSSTSAGMAVAPALVVSPVTTSTSSADAASASLLLSPGAAIRAASAPDVSNELADFLMRHGCYHYSFTFALFEITSLEKASILGFEALKAMAIPEKDAHALASLFKRFRDANTTSTSTEAAGGIRKRK